MLQVLKFAPAVEVQRPGLGFGAPRRVLRAVLLRAAALAVQLAVRLEAPARERPPGFAAVRLGAPVGVFGAGRVEAVVVLAVAAYFVAGLFVIVVQ